MRSAKGKILILLMIMWVMMSVFNVFYNFFKSVSEIREWVFLSDSQKRHKIFGGIYDFLIFVKENTDSKANLLIISNNDASFYLGIYYLYPRKITVDHEYKKIDSYLNRYQYDYVAVFGKNGNANLLNSNGRYLMTAKSVYGAVYKRK